MFLWFINIFRIKSVKLKSNQFNFTLGVYTELILGAKSVDLFLIFQKWISNSNLNFADYTAQISEQMSGPDLHVFTLKFLALKKLGFSLFRGQNFFFIIIIYYKIGIMQLFSADAIVFSKVKK